MGPSGYLDTPCPYCRATYPAVKREGARSTASGRVQRYYCKSCQKYFTERQFPGTKHPPRLIFAAITYYNQGHTLDSTEKQLKRRHRASVSTSTIHSWVKKYEDVCSFNRLRGKYDLDPEKTILSKTFQHDQIYTFKLHTLKANILGKSNPLMKGYLYDILKSFDSHPFESGDRCSETVRFESIKAKSLTTSSAPLLCRMALETARRAGDRHDKVEHFFLVNDAATVACEIPVYAASSEIKSVLRCWNGGNLHGHIDMLQNRRGNLVIMDYKPPPVVDRRVQNQLAMYAMLLSIRTKIPIKEFKCGYFNEMMHKEFYPAQILYQ